MMYFEIDRGRFDSALIYKNHEIAHTDYDIVVAYDRRHEEEIKKYAKKYNLPIEWRPSRSGRRSCRMM